MNHGSVPGRDAKPIDLRACKAAAARLFPPGTPFREALQQEPDFLPRPEGLVKLETYLRMVLTMKGTVDKWHNPFI